MYNLTDTAGLAAYAISTPYTESKGLPVRGSAQRTGSVALVSALAELVVTQ